MIKRLVTGTLLSLAAVSTVQAQDAAADRGWLLGGAVSFGDYSLDNNTIDDSAVGFQLTAQYRFNSWFGIEGAYLNSGEFEEDTDPQDPSGGDADLQVDGMSFTGVLYAPTPGNDIDVYAKAGLYTLDQSLEIDDTSSSSRKADGLTAGAGALVSISDQFAIRAEGNWYDFDGADYWVVNLGLDYRFGK